MRPRQRHPAVAYGTQIKKYRHIDDVAVQKISLEPTKLPRCLNEL